MCHYWNIYFSDLLWSVTFRGRAPWAWLTQSVSSGNPENDILSRGYINAELLVLCPFNLTYIWYASKTELVCLLLVLYLHVGQFVICPRKAIDAALRSEWLASSCFHKFHRLQTFLLQHIIEIKHNSQQCSFLEKFWAREDKCVFFSRTLNLASSCVYECDDVRLQTGKRWRTVDCRLGCSDSGEIWLSSYQNPVKTTLLAEPFDEYFEPFKERWDLQNHTLSL